MTENVIGIEMYMPELQTSAFFAFLEKVLFICGCAGSSLLPRVLSSCGNQGLLAGFSLQWLLLLMSTGSRVHGLR